MKRIFIIIVLFLPSYFFSQEEKSIFGTSFQYNTINYGTPTGEDLIYDVYSFFPIHKGAINSFGGKLEYQNERISGINSAFDQSVSAIDLNIIWNKNINEFDKLLFFGLIGIHSDFKDVSGDDFMYKLGGMYLLKINERFSTGFGLIYSRQFFGNKITPFVRFNYRMTSKFYISGLLPVKPIVIYKLNDNISWVTEISGKLESYRLSKTTFDNSYIITSGWSGITSLDVKIKKHHVFNIGIGGVIKQSLRYYDDSDGNDWKIITFDFTEKNKPIQEIKSSGLKFTLGYSYAL